MIEIPKTPHRRVVSNLFSLAAIYKREHPGVIDYFGSGTEVRAWIVAKDLARHPDFGIVFMGAPLDEVGDLQPYLVAEVVSASSKKRDYQEKRQDYLDYGIREYWIVDPLRRQLTILLRQGEGANATWTERVFKECRSDRESAPAGTRRDRRGALDGCLTVLEPDNQPWFSKFFVCQADFSWKRCSHCLSSTGSDSNGGAVRHRSGCATAPLSRS